MADQFRPRWPKLAALMDDSEHDVLAYMGFPVQHRTKLHSTNPLERLNREVQRRADVVGIFPSEQSILRLIGAVLLEANDEWQLQHRSHEGWGVKPGLLVLRWRTSCGADPGRAHSVIRPRRLGRLKLTSGRRSRGRTTIPLASGEGSGRSCPMTWCRSCG